MATLSKPSRRQLKPFAPPPGVRLGLLDGGVELGESDMVGECIPFGTCDGDLDRLAGCVVGVNEDTLRG